VGGVGCGVVVCFAEHSAIEGPFSLPIVAPHTLTRARVHASAFRALANSLSLSPPSLSQAGNGRHILNLGHGVLVGTPEEAVAHFFELSRQIKY
jgi:hypothetical protein